MANQIHTVVWGDTVYALANKYGVSQTDIGMWNDLRDINFIVVGQKLYMYDPQKSAAKSTSAKPIIKCFGQLVDDDATKTKLYIEWTWRDNKLTEKYQVLWQEDAAVSENGDDVIRKWLISEVGEADEKQGTVEEEEKNGTKYATFEVPEKNAAGWPRHIRCSVTPIPRTYTKNGKEYTHFTRGKTSDYVTYTIADAPPAAPSGLKVELAPNGSTINMSLDNLDSEVTKVIFEITKDDKTVVATKKVKVTTSHAAYAWSGTVAGSLYKVRCKAIADDVESQEWSEYSTNVRVVPSVSDGFDMVYAVDKDAVRLEWVSVPSATKYSIQYKADDKEFDNTTNEPQKIDIDVDDLAGGETYWVIEDLEIGHTYHFRMRASNDGGDGGWSSIYSIPLGTKPEAPTVWSSASSVFTDDPLVLYWAQNTADGARMSAAQIETKINGGSFVSKTFTYTIDEDEEEPNGSYEVDTTNSAFDDGGTLTWRVRTKGLELEDGSYSDWSEWQTVEVYATPEVSLELTDGDGGSINRVSSFPITVSWSVGATTNSNPIGYHISIVAKTGYSSVDEVGNEIWVSEGESIYSKNIASDELTGELPLNAYDVNLAPDTTYALTCTYTFSSGLSLDSTLDFDVAWSDETYKPDAEVVVDYATLTASIRPYCENVIEKKFIAIDNGDGTYSKSDWPVEVLWGYAYVRDPDSGGFVTAETTDGDTVWTGWTDEAGGAENEVTYYVVEEAELIPDVTLSVYRRELDGTFTEIATGVDHASYRYVTDPHPSLDYARYRIIAMSETTGAIGFTDIVPQPVGIKSAVIQWDESWRDVDDPYDHAAQFAQPLWDGSMVQLPYNLDVSDQTSPDTALVKYIGRKHPVLYHGTQVGSTSSWSAVIQKSDKDTLSALRRLQLWASDVYVREPSGTGYHATVTVSFNQNHKEVTIPVTISITRVEGGK